MRGVYLPEEGVDLLRGVPARGDVSQHALRQTPPCEQNEKHYLAATSLRTVNILDNTEIVMNK